MLDLVLHARAAALHEARARIVVGEVEDVGLGRFVILDLDDADASRLRLPHAQEPARIELLEQEFVGGRGRAEPMAEDLAGAVVLVHAHVMIAARIRAPDDLAVGVDRRVGQVARVLDVAHADRVVLRALHVDAPRQQALAGRMCGGLQVEEGLVVGELLAIEHDRLAPAVDALAADQRMLVALAVAAVIGERPVGRRRIGIVFLDARAHFLEQRAPQRRSSA